MPTTTPLNQSIPDMTDAADPALWLERFALSSPPVVTVASLTEANTRRDQYVTACNAVGVTPQPLMVWRTDVSQLFRDTGTGWEYIAGRMHSATVELARPALDAGGTPWLLYATNIVQATPGWTIVNNRLVVPATGRYIASFTVNVDGNSTTLGRVFGQLAINGNPQQARLGTATNENNYGGTVLRSLSAGNQIQITHYHATGGSLDVTATLEIDMISPGA